MAGNDPTEGTTNSFVMTQTNDATLIWLWSTNFTLTTRANGSGTVNVASGWYNAGTGVTVRATPIGAAHFFGWAGDTAGATINGTNITVNMSAAKSIVANFGLYLNVQAAGLDNSILYDPAPVVVVTNPTSHAAYTTTSQILNIGGKASNPVCEMARVEFSNDRGGSGVCTGTTNWSLMRT
jgi:hypothetical protein